MKRTLERILVCAILSIVFAAGCVFGDTTEKESTYEPFIRIDCDDPDAYDKDLENLRFITGDMYEFQDVKEKYGIPEDYIPDETGLDTLDVSASAQFNGRQFQLLADELREVAGEKEIYIIDLRRESHALLNDKPFSIYALHNWSNLGLSADVIMNEEENFFSSLIGTTIVAYTKEDDAPGDAYEYDIESYISERELVENENIKYIRIPIQDHRWPDPEYVDQFVDLVKKAGFDNLWMHIHCHTGKGRTGAFMVIYDKMKNPDIPIKEIAIRQAMLGSTYLLYTEDSDSWKAPLYKEKAKMTYLFGDYVEENKDTIYEMPWSEWLEQQELEEAS